ncbi:MAG: DUF2378 family protein [Deltaproteobacteria bacterium]|nr:DUF2378 family protein [Deltaproteobacteria bacterium]
MADSEPMNRGLVSYQMLKSPRLCPGSPGRARLLEAVDEETRAFISGSVLPGSWYPERLSVAMVHGVVKALELNTDAAVRAYFGAQQRAAYNLAYRALLRMTPTRRLVERAPAFWRRQHTAGELIVASGMQGSASGRIEGNVYVVDPIYAIGLAAGIEATLTMTGAKGAKVEERPVGEDTLLLDISWR